jgi:uncharacterized protein YbaP (TraB family)
MILPRLRFPAVLLLFGCALVQPAGAQDTAARAASRHSLWKVEGTNTTVHLLGSIHLLKEDHYPLPAPIEAAYSNSLVAVFESDVSRMQQPESQLKLMTKARLPAGETLKSQLSAETYARFEEHLKKLELPDVVFAQLKPSLAAITLAMLELQKMGFDPANGVDQHFYNRARQDGKTTEALESVEFQIDLLTDFTKEEGELLMKTTLEDIENTRKMYDEIVQAWKTGDVEGMEKLINEALREAPAIAKRLLTDRNRNWVLKIRELLHGGKPAIVIVGAGHLVGPEGVVALLRQQGFKVTQL